MFNHQYLLSLKQIEFKLLNFYSLALRFFTGVAVIQTSFFNNQLCKPQNFVFALSKCLGILSSLFSQLQTWQTSKLAFAFSQAYIFHVRVSFSHRTLIHSTQLLLFQQQISFPFHAFAEGYNATLRSIF
jgi:hypothetical protein